MKTLVDLVETVGIAGVAEDAELLVDRFETMTIDGRHALGGKTGAQRLKLGHRLEHACQPLDRGLRHDSTSMGA